MHALQEDIRQTAYYESKDQVNAIIDSFMRRYPFVASRNELQSEADYAIALCFEDYSKSRDTGNSIKGFIWTRVRSRLFELMRTVCRRRILLRQQEMDFNREMMLGGDKSRLVDLCDSLSDDAKQIVDLLLNRSVAVREEMGVRKRNDAESLRKAIGFFLQESANWDPKRIRRAFADIHRVLTNSTPTTPLQPQRCPLRGHSHCLIEASPILINYEDRDRVQCFECPTHRHRWLYDYSIHTGFGKGTKKDNAKLELAQMITAPAGNWKMPAIDTQKWTLVEGLSCD